MRRFFMVSNADRPGATGRELADDEIEPPPPAGLAQLSAALESFAHFLRVDADLISVAARNSPPLDEAEPKPARIRAWLAELPAALRKTTLSCG